MRVRIPLLVLGDTATLPFDGTMLTAADVSAALTREKERAAGYDDFELGSRRADDEVRGLLWWAVTKAREENVEYELLASHFVNIVLFLTEAGASSPTRPVGTWTTLSSAHTSSS
jgi:hypothetical protein